MEKTTIIWAVVIALTSLGLIVRLIGRFRLYLKDWFRVHHVFGVFKESDMFFCPGDDDSGYSGRDNGK